MPTFFTEGIVLSRTAVGDTDKSAVIYTDAHGKLTARVRAGQRSTSKLAGSIEPFSTGLFFFAQGRGGHTLTGADLTTTFPRLKSKLLTTASASVIAECVLLLTHEWHADKRVLDIVKSACAFLNQRTLTRGQVMIAEMWALWQLLGHLGIGLNLDVCVRCGKKLDSRKLSISYDQGGTLCASCTESVRGSMPLSSAALKLLRLAGGMALRSIPRIRASAGTITQALKCAHGAYQYQLDQASPALAFRNAVQ